MALTPRSGSLTTSSRSNQVPTEVPNTQTDIVNNLPSVGDSNLNQLAIDQSAYPNSTKLMEGFLKGKRVAVTYYRQQKQSGSNVRTNIADYPTTENILNKEFHKVINMEITLPKEFDFETNPQLASVGVTGEAYMYANSNPYIGDLFTMGIGDGRLGVFQISAKVPGSWRAGAAWHTRFVLQSFADSSDIDTIEAMVTQTSYFSKENYFGGVGALLSENTYLYLNKIKALRGILVRSFHNQFFVDDLNSYLRPDGLYDHALVRFMSGKISLSEVKKRPKNLMGQQRKSYANTLWARIDDRYNPTLFGLASQFRIIGAGQTKMGSFGNELAEHNVIDPELGLTNHDPYVFSENFYSGIFASMNEFEQIMYTAITTRRAPELQVLVETYLEQTHTLDPIDQFYRIPCYLHLIDISLQTQYRELDAPGMGYASQGG